MLFSSRPNRGRQGGDPKNSFSFFGGEALTPGGAGCSLQDPTGGAAGMKGSGVRALPFIPGGEPRGRTLRQRHGNEPSRAICRAWGHTTKRKFAHAKEKGSVTSSEYTNHIQSNARRYPFSVSHCGILSKEPLVSSSTVILKLRSESFFLTYTRP